jgi:hypothetical protein
MKTPFHNLHPSELQAYYKECARLYLRGEVKERSFKQLGKEYRKRKLGRYV